MTTVGEIMSRGLLSVEAGASLTAAAQRMTERDVLRAVAAGSAENSTVADWMTPNPETVDAGESTGHAAALMIHGGFRHLPVVEDDRLAGIVSIRDLIRFSLDDESPRGV